MSDIDSEKPPVVFISYSHDSEEHRERVLNLCNRLRSDNVDADIDQYIEHKPPKYWPGWMRHSIEKADYVLIVCTDTYRRRFEGEADKGQGKGAKWEGAIIELEMYEDELNTGDEEEARFIPIVFDKSELSYIPRILKGTNWYDVSDSGGYRKLLRHLKGIPTAIKPGLGVSGTVEMDSPYKAWKSTRKHKQPASDDEQYKELIYEELGTVRMLGSPDIPNIAVDLLDTFVSLDITAMSAGERREGLEPNELRGEMDRKLSPESALKRAFERHRMLLILGDPGSGKTTLVKYYAMLCLKGDSCKEMGFDESP